MEGSFWFGGCVVVGWVVQPVITVICKTLTSIHVHWFLLKLLSISTIFRGGMGWSLVGYGGGGWFRSKEKSFNRILMHIYLQSSNQMHTVLTRNTPIFDKIDEHALSWNGIIRLD